MKVRQIEPLVPPIPRKKRVGAYARVSTDKDAMIHSLSAQVSFYSDYIGKNPDWEYAGVFVDEALTGTKDTRPGFQKIMTECRAGNIDMLITKSISRFARNTVTILESVRELKALEVDIFFEEENIHSLSSEGELMLTILSSYAQEESLSVSENCKWRIRSDFKQGKPNTGNMLGYRLLNGVLTTIPEEAELVRAIFEDYLSGMGLMSISQKYRQQGVDFGKSGIRYLLQNEKYVGNMLLQKTFVSDHITKRNVINVGQLPKYLVVGSHKPIIEKSMFEAVQAEIAQRSAHHKPKPIREKYLFTGLIRCGQCGAAFRRKYNNAGTKYEKAVWVCETFRQLGKDACPSQLLPENILISKTMEALQLETLDEAILRICINKIFVPGHNRLVFQFVDGREIEMEWQNPSRRDSWTDEMKEKARQKDWERRNLL